VQRARFVGKQISLGSLQEELQARFAGKQLALVLSDWGLRVHFVVMHHEQLPGELGLLIGNVPSHDDESCAHDDPHASYVHALVRRP
jgi:hypothetical protein